MEEKETFVQQYCSIYTDEHTYLQLPILLVAFCSKCPLYFPFSCMYDVEKIYIILISVLDW